MFRVYGGVVALSILLVTVGISDAKVGTVAAVNQDMDGTPPSAARRSLEIGENIVQNEVIQTSDRGSGQLMFVDQTTLTVAPNSDMVIDSYVYDPEQTTGDMAIELTRGALRFIGGRLTKTQTATITTPSATIGIRGGMAIIRVLEDGSTRVIMLAGEFVQIGGGANRDPSAVPEILLSRPNAGAVVTAAGQVEFIGLVDSAGLAAEYAVFEGTGDGGSDSVSDSEEADAAVQTIAVVNSGISGGETNTPVSTSGEEEPDTDEDFINVENSDEAVTGITGGEGADEQQDALANFSTDGSASDAGSDAIGGDDVTDGDVTGGDVTGGDVTGGDVTGGDVTGSDVTGGDVTGGDVTGGDVTGGDVTGDVTGGDVTVGDVTGGDVTGGDVPVDIDIPVPSGGAVAFEGSNAEPFVTVEAGSLIGTTGEGRVITLPAAETPDDLINFSTLLAGLPPGTDLGFTGFEGVGGNTGLVVFDPSTGADDSFTGGLTGFGFSDLDENFHYFLFASAEELGIAVFGDPSPGFGPLLPSDNGTGDAATQNVVEQFSLLSFDGVEDSAPKPVFFVSNPGEPIGSTFAGTRALFADVTIDETATDGFQSNFSLFVANEGFDGRSLTNGETLFEGEVLSSTAEDNGLFFENLFLTSVSDDSGASVFGSNNDYIAVTGLVDGSSSELRRNGGETHVLGGPDQPADFASALLERNAGAGGLVQDPLPLLGQDVRPVDERGFVQSTVGAVAGIGFCSTGNCGTFQESGGRTGSYATQGTFGDSVSLIFTEEVTGIEQNEVLVTLRFSDDGLSELGSNDDFALNNIPDVTSDSFGLGSAYIDDNRFLVAVSSEEDTIQGVAGSSQTGTTSFTFASSGLAGDGDFNAYQTLSVDTEPEFARWGWWGTTISSNENGVAREDAVHLGTWVAGVEPLEVDIPFAGVVAYDGVAVGTEIDFQQGRVTPVGGRFGLTYDFGTDSGQFDLNIGSVQTSVSVFSGDDGRASFAGSRSLRTLDSRILETTVTGGFFSGPGNAVAATGGEFTHDVSSDGDLQRQTVGIFTGDGR